MNASAASVESWLGAQSFGEQRVGLLVRGEIVDEWRVEAYLGRGLSAEVYRVTNVRFGHDGALKLLVDGSRGLAARFATEADALRFLSLRALPRFMGGGLWTAFAFTLVIDWGWMKVFAVSCVMLAFWISCAHFLSRRKSS